MIKTLALYHVKSDFESMRIAYEYYIQNGHSTTLHNLQSGNPIRYIKISKYSPETQFSKLIISQELYKHLRSSIKNKRKKKGSSSKSIFRSLADYCFDCKDDVFEQLQNTSNKQKFNKATKRQKKRVTKGKKIRKLNLKQLPRKEYIQQEFNKQADQQEQQILAMEIQLQSLESSIHEQQFQGIPLCDTDSKEKKGRRDLQGINEFRLKIKGQEENQVEQEVSSSSSSSEEEEQIKISLPVLQRFAYSSSESSEQSDDSDNNTIIYEDSDSGLSDTSSMVNCLQELMEQQRIERELQLQIEEDERQLKQERENERKIERKQKSKKKIIIQGKSKIKRIIKLPKINNNDEQKEQQQQQQYEEEEMIIDSHGQRIPISIINALSYHDFSQDLGADTNNCQTKFLKTIFQFYCSSSDSTISYTGYKDLLRESGVIPCKEIRDYQIDLVYSKFTVKRGRSVVMSITEDRFRELLTEIAGIRYEGLGRTEAFVKLMRMIVWPYLLLRRKEIQLEYPAEYEYLKFLLESQQIDQEALEEEQQRILNDNQRNRIREQEKLNKKEEQVAEDDQQIQQQQQEEEKEIEEEEEFQEEITISDEEDVDDDQNQSNNDQNNNKEYEDKLNEKKLKLEQIAKLKSEQEQIVKDKKIQKKQKKDELQQQQEMEKKKKILEKKEYQRIKQEEKKKRRKEIEKKNEQAQQEYERQLNERKQEILRNKQLKKQKAKENKLKQQLQESPSNNDCENNEQQLLQFIEQDSIPDERESIQQIPQHNEEPQEQQLDSPKSPPKKSQIFKRTSFNSTQKLLSFADSPNTETLFPQFPVNKKEAVLQAYDSDDDTLKDAKFQQQQQQDYANEEQCCCGLKGCLQKALAGIFVFPKALCYIEDRNKKNEWAKEQVDSIYALHLPKNQNKVFRHQQSPNWKKFAQIFGIFQEEILESLVIVLGALRCVRGFIVWIHVHPGQSLIL